MLAGSADLCGFWFCLLDIGSYSAAIHSLPLSPRIINAKADVEMILVTDGITYLSHPAGEFSDPKNPSISGGNLGTALPLLRGWFSPFKPTVWAAVLRFSFWPWRNHTNALLQYISALRHRASKGRTWASHSSHRNRSLIGGCSEALLHHFGEVTHQPQRMWWCNGSGISYAAALWIMTSVQTS